MTDRKLTAEEVSALGLDEDDGDRPRALTAAEAVALGLEEGEGALSPSATFITKAAQVPAYGFVDELAGAIGAGVRAAQDLPSRLRGEVPTPFLEQLASDYRGIRGGARAQEKAQEIANPKAALAGTGAGVVLTALAPGPKVSGTAALRRAALQGATAGVGASEADALEGDLSGALRDAEGGAAFGVLGQQLGQRVLGPLAQRLLGRGAEVAEQKAVEQGRRVLTGGAEPLSSQKPISDASVMEALRSKAIQLLGTTEGAAQRLRALRESVGQEYGGILNKLEAAGVRGPDARVISDRLATRAAEEEASSVLSKAPGYLRRAAEQIERRAPPSTGEELRLGLNQAEGIKRSLQEQAAKEYARVGGNTALGDVKKEAAAQLRGAIEEAVEQQASRAPVEAAAFEPVKARLARIIEGSEAAEKGSARALRRQGASGGTFVKELMDSGREAGGQVGFLAKTLAAAIASNRSTQSRLALRISDFLGQLADEEAGMVGSQALGAAAGRGTAGETVE